MLFLQYIGISCNAMEHSADYVKGKRDRLWAPSTMVLLSLVYSQ